MKIGELLFELGFHADTMKLKDFGKAVGDLNMTSILAAGNFGVLFDGAKALIDITQDVASSVNHFSDITGESGKDIQQWTGLAKEAGIGVESVLGAVDALSVSVENFHRTGHIDNANAWAFLQLKPEFKNGTDALIAILEKLRGYSAKDQRWVMNAFKIDPHNLSLLKEAANIREGLNKIPFMDDKELQKSRDLVKEMADLSLDLQKIWTDLGSSLVPALDGLIKNMDNLVKNLKDSKELMSFVGFIGKAGMGLVNTLGTSIEGWKMIGKLITPLAQQLVTPNNVAFIPGTGNVVAAVAAERVIQSVTNNITINDSNDPAKTAKVISDITAQTYRDRGNKNQ